jgi:predicted kinase
MNQQVIITRGLSGAGKSTWSLNFARNNPNFIRVCRDDLRFMLFDGDFKEEWETAVLQARNGIIVGALLTGYNIIIDEAYLAPHRVKEIKEILDVLHFHMKKHLDIKIQDFIDVPLEICIERDKTRGKNRHVGEKFIRDYHETYVKPLLKDKGVTEWTI